MQREEQLRLALEEAEKFGPKDSRVALVLNNLASLSHNQGKRDEAQGNTVSDGEAHQGGGRDHEGHQDGQDYIKTKRPGKEAGTDNEGIEDDKEST